MSKLVQKILLALMIPIVLVFIVYQIDPALLDPSSEKSLFSMLGMGGGGGGVKGQLDLTGENAPSQLIGMLWTTFTMNDSSFAKSKRQRDPMKPLISLNREVQKNIQKSLKPVERARFPLNGGDINGILWNSRAPQAIIRGKRYKVGAKISDVEITAINKTSIDFRWRNKKYTLQRKRR